MATKKFDCVEMMHKGARRIYEETKGMTRAEELVYWRKKAKPASKKAQPRHKNRDAVLVSEAGGRYRSSR